MRFLSYIIIIVFPLVSLAQSSTDCPTWSKKKTSSKADYFKYLSGSQGKKNIKIIPEQQQKVTEQQQSVPVHVEKTNSATSTGNRSTDNFYTTRRYKLFPEEKKKVDKEEIKEIGNKVNEDKENNNSEYVEVKKGDDVTEEKENVKQEIILAQEQNIKEDEQTITPEEPKIEEVQKASSTPAIATDDSKASESSATSKVHKRKRDKIFNPGLRHNGVKKNRRIGKHRIDRCATKF